MMLDMPNLVWMAVAGQCTALAQLLVLMLVVTQPVAGMMTRL
jgi:hypothetical protein